jgi:hypothetical protein
MRTFEELKSELIEKAKKKRACAEQYKRAISANTPEELMSVVYDNLGWCIEHECITNEWLESFPSDVLLKSGCANTGKENAGFVNSGNCNSGDSNSGYRNSGAFCTDTNPKAILFNKESKMTVKEWENHPAYSLMYSIDPTIWVPDHMMTEEEKATHPKWETTGGYLKTIQMKEAWVNFWGDLTDENKAHFTTLPNFDAAIFEEITGIKTDK